MGLWEQTVAASRHALAEGALQPMETRLSYVDDGGIRFAVRELANLARKERSSGGERANTDPFAQPDPLLTVAELPGGYRCLLNKYNVIEHHLLIVTGHYEDQEQLLTEADFAALGHALAAIDGLGFYNGGRVAGASQPHKHLQLVPRGIGGDRRRAPIEALMGARVSEIRIESLPGLCFPHAFAWIDPAWVRRPDSAAAGLASIYRDLLATIALSPGEGPWQQGPYNLLVTRDWMLAVPRAHERINGIPINALGYAGALLVKDEASHRALVSRGPLRVLTDAAAAAA